MQKLPLLLAILFLTCGVPGQAQDHGPLDSGGPLLPEQAAYDVVYYDLALRVDPAQRSIDGVLTVSVDVVAPLDVLVLDLDTVYTITEVARLSPQGEARPLRFNNPEGRLYCVLDTATNSRMGWRRPIVRGTPSIPKAVKTAE